MVNDGFKAPCMVIFIFTQLIFNKINDIIVGHDLFPISFSNGNKVLGSILQWLNDLGLVWEAIVGLDKLETNDVEWINKGVFLQL